MFWPSKFDILLLIKLFIFIVHIAIMYFQIVFINIDESINDWVHVTE